MRRTNCHTVQIRSAHRVAPAARHAYKAATLTWGLNHYRMLAIRGRNILSRTYCSPIPPLIILFDYVSLRLLLITLLGRNIRTRYDDYSQNEVFGVHGKCHYSVHYRSSLNFIGFRSSANFDLSRVKSTPNSKQK